MINNLPKEFINEIKEILENEEAKAFFEVLNAQPQKALRLNLLKKHSPEMLNKISGYSPFPLDSFAYYIQEEDEMGKSVYHQLGAYYMQEPSAMIPVLVLDPKPGEKILDLCAAPGGKASQIGERLRGEGVLVANEIVRSRALVLNENLKRMGICNAVVCSMKPNTLAEHFPDYFDAILVDAPCSGEGMFRKNPMAISEWSIEHVKSCSIRQFEILRSAVKMLKPGGRIVYSTCTLNKVENEELVDKAQNELPLHLQKFELNGLASEEGILKIWPHRFSGEGHFIALLHKLKDNIVENYSNKMYSAPTIEETIIFNDFCKKNNIQGFQSNYKYRDYLMQVPENINFDKLNLIDVGVRLGYVKNKMFFPEHQFAQVLHNENIVHYSLNKLQVKQYLAGHEVHNAATDLEGFILLRFDSYTVGWGKIKNGIIKNHYPKQFRKNINL